MGSLQQDAKLSSQSYLKDPVQDQHRLSLVSCVLKRHLLPKWGSSLKISKFKDLSRTLSWLTVKFSQCLLWSQVSASGPLRQEWLFWCERNRCCLFLCGLKLDQLFRQTAQHLASARWFKARLELHRRLSSSWTRLEYVLNTRRYLTLGWLAL